VTLHHYLLFSQPYDFFVLYICPLLFWQILHVKRYSFGSKISKDGDKQYIEHMIIIRAIKYCLPRFRSLFALVSIPLTPSVSKNSQSKIQNLSQKISHLTIFRKCICMQESISIKYG